MKRPPALDRTVQGYHHQNADGKGRHRGQNTPALRQAERLGGQVLDTLGIENLIAVQETEGPKLAAALQENVRHYGVDVLGTHTATALKPAAQPGDLAEVTLANGATLKAQTVVLATGARWREMGVPGEAEYKTRGVAFCPHCDGPLFKGKPVAVIGGGNSGVEAAIDLAGIVEHVTLFEFMPMLKADAVLQKKLQTLPNVRVITQAQIEAQAAKTKGRKS